MSFFDSLEEYTVSPFKVGVNLAGELMQTHEFPSWDQIVGAFKKHDDSHLPQLELTNNKQATELTDRIMEHGNITISRVSDVYPNVSQNPFTLSRPGG
jgi:hypothetical protein